MTITVDSSGNLSELPYLQNSQSVLEQKLENVNPSFTNIEMRFEGGLDNKGMFA